MQLDSTRVAIRERSLPEVFDLALHVTREFAGPWVGYSLLAIVPLAVLNHFLVGWMAASDYEADVPGLRYAWAMTLLVFIEAPLASVFLVGYLGPAVFQERKTFRQVVGDVVRYSPQLFLSQLLLRGILPVWLLYLTVDRYTFTWPVEALLVPANVCWSTAMRCFRPYITEIILLERNPLWSRDPQRITIARRSAHLHGPSSADLFVRWILSALIGVVLLILAIQTATALTGILIGQWPITQDEFGDNLFELHLSPVHWLVLYPATLWLVVAYFSVVRFLSYLDLRIRHEGWEVELLMRAEALRINTKLG
jgi:hypothetical protein